MSNNGGYKVGDWIEDIQDGDLYEILEVWGNDSGESYKIGKKFDGRTKSQYKSIFNRSFYFKDLAKQFKPAPLARLLLQYEYNK